MLQGEQERAEAVGAVGGGDLDFVAIFGVGGKKKGG